MNREIACGCRLEKAVSCLVGLGNIKDPNETNAVNKHNLADTDE
jgi:hypothetical protein